MGTQFACLDELILSSAFSDRVQISEFAISVNNQSLSEFLIMDHPELYVQVMVSILGLESPQVLKLEILFLVERGRHVADKVEILGFQGDEELMLVVELANALVVGKNLFKEFVFR